ncbi:MAG: DNA translocase FtsK 4TM domain-containing protein, partial [Acidobacteriota bacterium]|nr:DNA translocase FtsK 4TM domain-containing protein [Acidobacteriota bacterium]
MAAELEKNRAGAKNNSRGNEIVALVLAGLAALVFLSLITYSPNDSTPFFTSSSQKTQNWIGVFGSTVANLLFQTIGITAFLLPVLLFLVAWRIFRSESLYVPIGRAAGFVTLLISLSGLLALLMSSTVFDGSFKAGGMIGDVAEGALASLLSKVGAGILLSMFLVMSILIITSFSFDSFFASFSMAWKNFRLRFGERFSKYKAQRDAKKEARAKMEKRPVTKIEKSLPKTPTISASEKNAVAGKKQSIGEKVSGIFGRFTKSSEKEIKITPEIIDEKEPQIEAEGEISPPVISVSEQSAAPRETSIDELMDGAETIPITPMPQETGELEAEILEDASETDEANKIEEPTPRTVPPKPQNFDDYVLPKAEFLNPAPPRFQIKEDEARALAKELEEKTKEFNATGRVVNICPGPVVTTYEYKPDPGVKYSRITGLTDDLCLALKAESIRIDRIPGKAFVGIEVPNRERDTIYLREVIESKKFTESKSLLTLALGKTIDGLNYVADLAKMPHLLIAGATGAGKSVGVNTLVVSILYKAKPDEVKFIMVDPKRLELGLYADIPHLATPIITDPKRAAISLKWAVSEMEKRYKDLAGWGVRNIDGFNSEVKKRNAIEHFDENGEPWKPLPY